MKKHLAFVVVALGVLGGVAACSSSSDSTFGNQKAEDDGGPPPISPIVPEASTDDSGDSGPAQCSPKIPDDYKATWAKPVVDHTACTADELTDYFNACLADPNKKDQCATFAAAHDKCVKCTEPADGSGPIQWFMDRLYYALNVPSCIALVEGNTADDSCGAAYNAVLQCTRVACEGCLATGGNFDTDFKSCRTNAQGTGLCKSYDTVRADTCKNVTSAGSDATVTCSPGSSTPVEHYTRVMTLFCGPTR
ncbi:hypothetical protein [Labilithrix luteola]|nr:hypothetical protein [Labilithrix luteola]